MVSAAMSRHPPFSPHFSSPSSRHSSSLFPPSFVLPPNLVEVEDRGSRQVRQQKPKPILYQYQSNHDHGGLPTTTAIHSWNSSDIDRTILHRYRQCIVVKRNWWWRVSAAAMAMAAGCTVTIRNRVVVTASVIYGHTAPRRRGRCKAPHCSEG